MAHTVFCAPLRYGWFLLTISCKQQADIPARFTGVSSSKEVLVGETAPALDPYQYQAVRCLSILSNMATKKDKQRLLAYTSPYSTSARLHRLTSLLVLGE